MGQSLSLVTRHGLVRVFERGFAMDVDMAAGPDVGLYTDMRDLRAWLEPHWGAHASSTLLVYRRVLGGRRIGWASEIVSVDCSAPIVARSEQNFRANGLDPDAHDFLVLDVWKAFDRLRRTGRRFDRVVVDPPSFSRSDGETFSMKKGYPRLVAAACRVLEDEGWLILASNHGGTSPHQFQECCIEGMREPVLRSTLVRWDTERRLSDATTSRRVGTRSFVSTGSFETSLRFVGPRPDHRARVPMSSARQMCVPDRHLKRRLDLRSAGCADRGRSRR